MIITVALKPWRFRSGMKHVELVLVGPEGTGWARHSLLLGVNGRRRDVVSYLLNIGGLLVVRDLIQNRIADAFDEFKLFLKLKNEMP